MYSIEQAIYTSARTKRADGYQIVAHSPGAKDVDLREIAAWAPSHDSLAETSPGVAPTSVNFHPLPSGAFCVSKSSTGGDEFSNRGGERVYSQCLIVPADVLTRFGNNPFSVLTAASAQGSIRVREDDPDSLDPIRVGGRAAVADPSAIAACATEYGPDWLAALVQAIVAAQQIAIVVNENRPRLMACILSLVPVECRPQISVSTGLRFSPRRPCRMVGLPGDSTDQLKALKRHGTPALDPRGKIPSEFAAKTGWGGFVGAAIAGNKLSFLIAQLGRARNGLAIQNLSALGNALRDELSRAPEGAPVAPSFALAPSFAPPTRPVSASPATSRVEAPIAVVAAPSDAAPERRCDSAQTMSRREIAAPRTPAIEIDDSPSQTIGWQCPAVLEQLEAIDDLVFEAIAGKASAVEKLRTSWPAVLAKLGPDLIEESRENYVRHALRVWKECVDGEQIRQPALAISAMEVVCILCNA